MLSRAASRSSWCPGSTRRSGCAGPTPPPAASLSRMEKRYLFTPGPTPVPPEVLAAGAEPMVHHRGSDFQAIYTRTLERLQQVFRTESQVLLFSASGTGAMESAVTNLAGPGRQGRGRRRGRVRRALGQDLRAPRPRRAAHRLRVGRGARRRARSARRSPRAAPGSCSAPSPRRRPASSRTSRGSRQRWATRSSSSTPSPRSARSRSRPTPGASTSSSPARRRR